MPDRIPGQKPHSQPQAKTAPASPDAVPAINGRTLRPDELLQLQRTLGNHRVQRLLKDGTLAIQQRQNSGTLQREDDDDDEDIPNAVNSPLAAAPRTMNIGLELDNRKTGFVNNAYAYMNAAANADKTLSVLADALNTLAGDELAAIGVPRLTVTHENSGNIGLFHTDANHWGMHINARAFSKTAATTTVAQLTPEERAEVVNVIYHESRHGEQWFHIAQMKAGQGLTVAQLQAALAIPANIATAAAARPVQKAGAAGGAAEIVTADTYSRLEGMFESIYGANKAYRHIIVGAGLKQDTDRLKNALKAVNPLTLPKIYPPAAMLLTPEELAEYDTTDLEVDVTAFRNDINAGTEDWDDETLPEIEAELTRVKAIADKSAQDSRILNHLLKLKEDMAKVQTVWAEPHTTANVTALIVAVMKLQNEFEAAYYDLPEEEDALAVGESAKSKFAAKG